MVNLTRAVVISALVPLCVHTSITRAAAPRVLLDECWETTFLEPFDELNLANESNPAGWTTQYIWDRNTIINQELQYYIDPRLHEVNPFVVEQGILSITAMKTPAALSNRVAEQAYVSGVLTSRNWFEQQHGRFEVKAKVGYGLHSGCYRLTNNGLKGLRYCPNSM